MTAITIDGEEVMTDDEWKILVEIEELKTELDNARRKARADIAQFMQKPGYQNGMRGIEEMEAAGK